jgi:membrane protease YdiL (CAAX protease family)
MSPSIEHVEVSPEPFWSYRDLFLFLGVALPSLLLSAGVVRLMRPRLQLSEGFEELLAQFLWYILVFGFLIALFRIAYGRPFWRSLGFAPPFPYAGLCFALGPLLAMFMGYLGYLLKTPVIDSPFEKMLADRPTTILFVIFGVFLGPLCEELAFRGFLMPLLMRTFGTAAGILSTAALFGALHAPEYHKTWQYAVLIGGAGAVFGYVRYRTGSTASSTFMHIGYNLIQFVAMWVRTGLSPQ